MYIPITKKRKTSTLFRQVSSSIATLGEISVLIFTILGGFAQFQQKNGFFKPRKNKLP